MAGTGGVQLAAYGAVLVAGLVALAVVVTVLWSLGGRRSPEDREHAREMVRILLWRRDGRPVQPEDAVSADSASCGPSHSRQ